MYPLIRSSFLWKAHSKIIANKANIDKRQLVNQTRPRIKPPAPGGFPVPAVLQGSVTSLVQKLESPRTASPRHPARSKRGTALVPCHATFGSVAADVCASKLLMLSG